MQLYRKDKLFWLILSVIIIVTIFVLGYLKSLNQSYKKGTNTEFDDAIVGATDLYRAKVDGMDLSTGPCLTNDLKPNWVVDIVHSPRIPIDDLPENQCQAYTEGRAKHFVELDLKGNLIRVK